MVARAAVVGWPIAHSLSPTLHRYWINQYHIQDASYEAIAIQPGTFKQRILRLRDQGFRGVNVTIPFKEEAFALADKTDSAAQFSGAANLIFFSQGDIIGRNTDIPGIQDSLMQSLGSAALGGRNIVLLGAGGAARAVAYALQALKVARISILNRHRNRADELVADITRYGGDSELRTGTLLDWPDAARDAWLVVNATSAGMTGHPPLEIDIRFLAADARVCDIVYNPLMTPLLREAAARGHKIIDGLGMLMHQAAPSFQVFFYKEMQGKMPEVTAALRTALIEALRARG